MTGFLSPGSDSNFGHDFHSGPDQDLSSNSESPKSSRKLRKPKVEDRKRQKRWSKERENGKQQAYIPSYVQDGDMCVVCGDASTGTHYRAMTCEGCKGFFRRTVQNCKSEDSKFTCKKNGKCPVNASTRNGCQYCRFQKCLSARMDPNSVLNDIERRKLKKKIQINRLQKSLNRLLTEAEMILLRKIGDSFRSSKLSSFYIFLDRHKTAPTIGCSPGVQHAIDFITGIPGIQSIDRHDLLALLKTRTIDLLALCLTQLYDPQQKVLTFCDHHLSEAELGHFPEMERILRFTRKFNLLAANPVILGCLSAIRFFSTDDVTLHNANHVEAMMENLLELFLKYLRQENISQISAFCSFMEIEDIKYKDSQMLLNMVHQSDINEIQLKLPATLDQLSDEVTDEASHSPNDSFPDSFYNNSDYCSTGFAHCSPESENYSHTHSCASFLWPSSEVSSSPAHLSRDSNDSLTSNDIKTSTSSSLEPFASPRDLPPIYLELKQDTGLKREVISKECKHTLRSPFSNREEYHTVRPILMPDESKNQDQTQISHSAHQVPTGQDGRGCEFSFISPSWNSRRSKSETFPNSCPGFEVHPLGKVLSPNPLDDQPRSHHWSQDISNHVTNGPSNMALPQACDVPFSISFHGLARLPQFERNYMKSHLGPKVISLSERCENSSLETGRMNSTQPLVERKMSATNAIDLSKSREVERLKEQNAELMAKIKALESQGSAVVNEAKMPQNRVFPTAMEFISYHGQEDQPDNYPGTLQASSSPARPNYVEVSNILYHPEVSYALNTPHLSYVHSKKSHCSRPSSAGTSPGTPISSAGSSPNDRPSPETLLGNVHSEHDPVNSYNSLSVDKSQSYMLTCLGGYDDHFYSKFSPRMQSYSTCSSDVAAYNRQTLPLPDVCKNLVSYPPAMPFLHSRAETLPSSEVFYLKQPGPVSIPGLHVNNKVTELVAPLAIPLKKKWIRDHFNEKCLE